MESGGAIRWLRMRLVLSLRNPVRRTSPSTCRLLTLVGLEVSLGCFRAESRTVLGRQAPRVEASQGFYYSGFIQPNKQPNKQTNAMTTNDQRTTVFCLVASHLASPNYSISDRSFFVMIEPRASRDMGTLRSSVPETLNNILDLSIILRTPLLI